MMNNGKALFFNDLKADNTSIRNNARATTYKTYIKKGGFLIRKPPFTSAKIFEEIFAEAKAEERLKRKPLNPLSLIATLIAIRED